jgi:predicted metal-dependent hydrolase
MRIDEHGEVQLRAPKNMSVGTIVDFVSANTRFLAKTLEIAPQTKIPKELATGNVLAIFGKQYLLEVSESSRASMKIDHSNQVIVAKSPDKKLPLKKFYALCAKELEAYIAPRCAEIAPYMSRLSPQKLRYKLTRSLWGSCTTSGNITFNKRLLHYPKEVIDYVIVHELAHLQLHNHSEQFWNIVESHCPEHKTHRKVLKTRMFG